MTDAARDALGGEFISGRAAVNGTRLHYVRGGDGPAVVLLHGFPQDWYEWRGVMPALAETFTVVAVDLRGVGGSEPAADGFDAATMARDVHELFTSTEGLDQPYLVGHDIGGWVAYALARSFPHSLRGAMIVEALIPGIEALELVPADVALWHGEFHQIPELPEALVADRQAVYFRHFFDIGTVENEVISDADVEHYAAAYAGPRLHAAFDTYRAYAANAAANDKLRGPIAMPLTLVGGEHVFAPALSSLPQLLNDDYGWADVRSETIPGAKHYVVEEFPQVITDLIRSHAST